MPNDNPNRIDNGGNGTFFGNLLRGALSLGKLISPNVIGVIANATGLGDVPKVLNALKGDNIEPKSMEFLMAEFDKDKAEMLEITKRWESDNKSQNWLPRNIRPLVVANFTLLIDFVLIASQFGRPIAEAYLPILMTMGVTAIGGYFTLREFGKTKEKK